MSTPGPHGIAPTLNRAIRYDAVHDCRHVALVGSLPHVLLANPKLPVRSVQELVGLARRAPGRYDFASGGTGVHQPRHRRAVQGRGRHQPLVGHPDLDADLRERLARWQTAAP